MTMAQFLQENQEEILKDWESFAATLTPAAEGLSATELRNLAAAILRSLAQDMKAEQSEQQRHQKSTQGLRAEGTTIGHQAREAVDNSWPRPWAGTTAASRTTGIC